MMHAKTVLLLGLLALGLAPRPAEAAVLTGVWEPCSRSSPTLNECMTKSVEKFLPIAAKGMPKYNVPTMDPIVVGSADFSTKDLQLKVNNAVMKGVFTDFKVALVEAEPDKYAIRLNLKIPKIVNEGEYELGGKLLMMPVSGSGHYVITYTDVSFDLRVIGKSETRDGKNYLKLEDVKVILMPGNIDTKVDNLFNGNKELSDNFHKVVNENWKEIFDDVKEKIWTVLGGFFKDTLAKLYDVVPYDEIYLP